MSENSQAGQSNWTDRFRSLAIRIAVLLFSAFVLFASVTAIFKTSIPSTNEPEKVTWAQLADGYKQTNRHIELPEHYALYYALDFYKERKRRDIKGHFEEIGPHTEIESVNYPIVPVDHPAIVEWLKVIETYGGEENLPEDQRFPSIPLFNVLLTTQRYETYGDLPAVSIEKRDAVSGMALVSNPLLGTSSYLEPIQHLFPEAMAQSMVIFAEGDTPPSLFLLIFLALVALIVLVLTFKSFLPDRRLKKLAQAMEIQSPDSIYPHIVPSTYLEQLGQLQEGYVRPIGHDLYVVFVHEMEGMIRYLNGEDLEKIDKAPHDLYELALRNLERLAMNRELAMKVITKGPQDKPFMIFADHWAAASCILLPALKEMVQRGLNTDEVCLSIPHRDILLAFPKGDETYRQEMIEMIREKEEPDAEKPLTWELFELVDRQARPLSVKPPKVSVDRD